MGGKNYKTMHYRLSSMYRRMNMELTESIKELVSEAKQGNRDNMLEFVEGNRVYNSNEESDAGETLFGIDLKSGKILYSVDGESVPLEYNLTYLAYERRLDILEDLSSGKYTTYRE